MNTSVFSFGSPAAALSCVAIRLSLLLSLCVSATSQAALFGRDLDGDTSTFEAVYDDVLDISWLADANLAASQTFGVAGIDSSGSMSWDTANQWIGAMNSSSYLGVNGWRQAAINPLDGSSYNTSVSYNGSTDVSYMLSATAVAGGAAGSAGATESELAYHYFNNFGGQGWCDGSATNCVGEAAAGLDEVTGSANYALFDNIQNASYWSGNELAAGSTLSWYFNNAAGLQNKTLKSRDYFVWAVTDGDVSFSQAVVGGSEVPLPASAWLLLSGLLSLAAFKRR